MFRLFQVCPKAGTDDRVSRTFYGYNLRTIPVPGTPTRKTPSRPEEVVPCTGLADHR